MSSLLLDMTRAKELGERILENRRRRGWPSATDLSKTTRGFVEELGEWIRATRRVASGDKSDVARELVVDALGDALVYALGALAILGEDATNKASDLANVRTSRDGARMEPTFERAVVAIGQFESLRTLDRRHNSHAMAGNVEQIVAFAERELRAMDADPETVVRAIVDGNAVRVGQVPH